jgi:hypothetical protein
MGQLSATEAKKLASRFTENKKLSRVAEAKMQEAVDELACMVSAGSVKVEVVREKV